MKYGLGQIDFNLLAQLALSGLSDTPERDVAALLRSGQPIELETRRRLANAFEARGNGFHLKFYNMGRTAGYRAFVLRRRRLQIGRETIALSATQGSDRAQEMTADKYGCSTKTVSANIAFARRLDAWLASVRADPSRGTYSDFAIEVAFLYADATNKHPDEALKPSAEMLAALIESFDNHQAPALRGKRRR